MYEFIQAAGYNGACMVINTFLKIVIGRQFGYNRALEIVQDEQYLEDSDFDEIRRLDVIKKIGEFNPDLNLPKQHQKGWLANLANVASNHKFRVQQTSSSDVI